MLWLLLARGKSRFFLPLVTIALTMSPVLNPKWTFCWEQYLDGNPNLLLRHCCLVPCSFVVISKGWITSMISFSGVDLPTLAASNQWVFGKSWRQRENLQAPAFMRGVWLLRDP